MRLSYQFARRYLFGKKSTNVINIITGISITGIAVGSCALILVMSVFNGFHDLLYTLFNSFNPPAKVMPVEGKVFSIDPKLIADIKSIEGVTQVSVSLEETAMFQYDDQRAFGTVKGVDEYYIDVNGLDSVITEGEYAIKNDRLSFAVLGAGIKSSLGVNVNNEFESLVIHMPKRRKSVSGIDNPFNKQRVFPKGVFSFQQEYDREYVITSLEVVRALLNYTDEASFLEISYDEKREEEVFEAIQEIIGPEFLIKNRYQQEEAFLKIMNGEKWMGFAILTLTLLLVAFNLVGALYMIVIDKKKDISILKTMGATRQLIRNIFLGEGLLVCTIGLVVGYGLALIFFFLQSRYSIIPIQEGFIVDSYPIRLKLIDFIAGALAVLGIGFIASILPALKADKVGAYIREE